MSRKVRRFVIHKSWETFSSQSQLHVTEHMIWTQIMYLMGNLYFVRKSLELKMIRRKKLIWKMLSFIIHCDPQLQCKITSRLSAKKLNEWKNLYWNAYLIKLSRCYVNVSNYSVKALAIWALILGISSSLTLQQPPTIRVPWAIHSGIISIQDISSSGLDQWPRSQCSPLLG